MKGIDLYPYRFKSLIGKNIKYSKVIPQKEKGLAPSPCCEIGNSKTYHTNLLRYEMSTL